VDSFEDLGVAPELVEALTAEGVEVPTPLQEAAIPLLRKGNNLVMAAGPGSGLMAAWAVPLLEQTDAEEPGTRLLVVTSDRETAGRLAESLARLARDTGHTVASLGSAWALPQRAQVLVGTPADVVAAAGSGTVTLDAVAAVVFDQAQAIERLVGLDQLEQILQFVPAGAQRVLSALPTTPAVQDFIERHLKRTLTVPAAHDPASTPPRGAVRYRVVTEPTDDALADLVEELFEQGTRHVLVFCRSEDRAADIGDRITLRGYVAGAPGDTDVPVWLGVDALEARSAIEDRAEVVVVSADVPTDPDALDRRHGISGDGVVLVLPREVAHLKDVTRRTGYTLTAFPAAPRGGADPVRDLHATLEGALASEDIGPYLLALAPLFERHDPAEVAAAAVALLRRRAPLPGVPAPSAPRVGAAAGGPAWAKLFITIGSRDGLVPGDLVGAVTGEAGVPGDTVGRIDIKESHTLLEVHDSVAGKVIKALNGTTIRGRSVRVDFDRPRKQPAGPRGGAAAPRRRPPPRS